MLVAMNFTGIRNHLSVLSEEKRKIAILKDSLTYLARMAENDPLAEVSPLLYQRCCKDLDRLEKSVEGRMSELEELVEKAAEQSERNSQTFERIEALLRQLEEG